MGLRRLLTISRVGVLVPAILLTTLIMVQRGTEAALPSQDGLVWPTKDAVTSDYNEQPCGPNESHLGYDMNVWGAGIHDLGEPIFAAFSGTVVQKVTSGVSFGNRVAVRHQLIPGGSSTKYETFYAHLQGFATGIAVGTKVSRGQLIGFMGESGSPGEVHLHFEIRRRVNDTSSTVLGPGDSLNVDSTIGCTGAGARLNLVAKTPMNLKWSDLWVMAWWGIRNSNTGGVAEGEFTYGRSNDVLVVGDWNGDGIDTPGLVRCNLWIMNNGFDSQFDFQFQYGAGDCSMKPVVGDWDGDGVDEPGMVSGNTWLLNYDFDGQANISCSWASSTHKHLGGDWNGDGVDSPGAFAAPYDWFMNNACDSTTDISFQFGSGGALPVVGNWDGGTTPGDLGLADHPGVVIGNVWFLNNGFDCCSDWAEFGFGSDTHTPLAGDWNNDVNSADDTPGVGGSTT
jgi:peptidase M23-like protein